MFAEATNPAWDTHVRLAHALGHTGNVWPGLAALLAQVRDEHMELQSRRVAQADRDEAAAELRDGLIKLHNDLWPQATDHTVAMIRTRLHGLLFPEQLDVNYWQERAKTAEAEVARVQYDLFQAQHDVADANKEARGLAEELRQLKARLPE